MTEKNISNLYLDFLKRAVDLKRPLRVVFDCSNGAVGPILKKLKIRNLKFKIINGKPDGNFPAHGPDPSKPGAFFQLARAVKRYRADAGIVFDADGDRAVFIDEKGGLVEPYLIAYLLFLNSRPPFVADIFIFEALKYAGLLFRKTFASKVGSYFVKKNMAKHKASLGAEYSGHYYFREFFGADAGILAALKMIKAVSRLPYSLSQFKEFLPQKLSIQKFNFETREPEKFVKIIKKRYKKMAKKTSEIDGIILELEKGWCIVRPSNTEPLIRIFLGKKLP